MQQLHCNCKKNDKTFVISVCLFILLLIWQKGWFRPNQNRLRPCWIGSLCRSNSLCRLSDKISTDSLSSQLFRTDIAIHYLNNYVLLCGFERNFQYSIWNKFERKSFKQHMLPVSKVSSTLGPVSSSLESNGGSSTQSPTMKNVDFPLVSSKINFYS